MSIKFASFELFSNKITTVSDTIKGIALPIPFMPYIVNIWFLKQEDGWFIFDCGYNDETTKAIWQKIILKEIFPIKGIIISHFHLDHAALAGWVAEKTNAPIYTSHTEWLMMHFLHYDPKAQYVEVFKQYYEHALVSKNVAQTSLDQIYIYPEQACKIPNYFHLLKEGDHFDNWKVKTVKGHAQEMITLHHLYEKIVISCDHILPNINPNVSFLPFFCDSNPMQYYIDDLERFRDIADDYLILPSHGQPFYKINAEITRNFAYREARFKKLLKICDTYKPIYEIATTLYKKPCSASFFFYFLGDVWSHLIYLHHSGKLMRKIENGKEYYKSA